MYAKALIPGPPLDIPALVATTSRADLNDLLLARSWAVFGPGGFPEPTGSAIVVRPDRLTIKADDLVVLDDGTNPVSPPGWWQAVDGLGSRCVVIIPTAGASIDLTISTVGSQLLRLINAGQGVCAILPVRDGNWPPRSEF